MLRRRSVLASIVAATLKGQHPLTPQEHSTLTWALDRSIEETNDHPSMRSVHGHLTWLADTRHESPKLSKLAAGTERCGGARLVDELHRALMHVLAGEERLVGSGDDVDDGVADRENVDRGVVHGGPEAQEGAALSHRSARGSRAAAA